VAIGDNETVRLIEITDASDERLSDFRALTDADVRADRRAVVIAEGINVVERLVHSPYRVRAVIGTPARIEALGSVLDEDDAVDVPAYAMDKWLLSEVVGFHVTRGILASADRPVPLDPAELLRSADRIAVLESLNDFENLGSLFRNVAAFGLDGVLLDPQCADPLYRRSVRVSMGHVLRVPFAVLPAPWPDSLDLVSRAGFQLLAMTPRLDAAELKAITPPPRWALLLGAEGPGLSVAAMARADQLVRIPMAPGVDSLNVATAAAVGFAGLT
jgi:tRNA G18 (ribose-2'-O)-methylase SpoU